jgi:DNA-directed RNA polymerase subunit M/transcription elongation factor TFIIS
MGYNYYQRQRRTTNTDVGQDARFDELGMYGLYQSPHHESSFLVNQLDNAGQVMLAARREPEFDENGLEISGTGDTELDAYWINASLRTTQARDIDPIDLADEDLSGLPLEAQEHIKGLQTERRRHREKALAADLLGIDRASRCRTSVETEFSNRRAEVESRLIDSEPGLTRFSPLDDLEEDQVAAVRDAAASAAETLVTPPKIEVLEHRIAARVLTGQDVFTAVSNVLDALYQEAGVIQPISSVPAVPSKYDVEADIQGEVVTLWDPKATNQQQVGLIEDDTGRIKFTVWLRSNQGVILREGDLVRIRAGKVGKYRGGPTLAADSQTLITVIEKGDGPAPRRPSFDFSGSDGRFRGRQRPRACSIPALSDPGVSQEPLPSHRPRDRRDADDGRLAATHWLKSAEIYDEDGDIPIPEWWKDQPNTIRVEVPADADSVTINRYIENARRDAAGDINRSAGDRPVNDSVATDTPVFDEPDQLQADGGETRTLWVCLPDTPTAPSEASADSKPDSEAVPEPPSTTVQCPASDCGSDRAYYRLQQLRASDEAPTRLYSCIQCGKKWREND